MSLAPSNNPNIVYQDTATGIYKDLDGTWYLKNGTPINDYDPNTGAYQEYETGPWYTFQGVELLAYDKVTGNYQDSTDQSWYTFAGVPINENTKQPALGAVPVPSKAITKPVSNQTPWIVIGGSVIIVFVVLGLIALSNHYKKNKK